VAGPPALDAFRSSSPRGVFLDFDGSLSEIVERPDLATPVEGALDALAALAGRVELVAVVTGRTGADLAAVLPAEGIRVFGQYGLPGDEGFPPELHRAMSEISGAHPGTWIEDKGGSVAVHFREAADPDRTGAALEMELRPVVEAAGLRLQAGKRVWEAVPADTPGKGAVVLREARSAGLRGILFAGDDVADLGAFVALDTLRGEGRATVKVAVRSEETPASLVTSADLVVERPAGLVELLASL
jgi:trehalose 6-phosphate phosphatase